MKAVIIVPSGHQELENVATVLQKGLKKHMKIKKSSIISLDVLDSTTFFLDNHVVLIGVPTVKGDIFWPLQVKVDGLIHTVLKEDLSSILVSGFTFSDDLDESTRNLEAILWTFHETSAKVMNDGLHVLNSDNEGTIDQKIKEFLILLKTTVKEK